MSIHLYSFSDTPLLSVGEWQQFIDAIRFPLRLPGEELLDQRGGTIVAQLRGKQVSFQYRFEDSKQLMESYTNVNFGRGWRCLLVLPWIYGFDGLDAAWMAATSYAAGTGGIVFDPQEGRVYNSEEALQVIDEMERTAPQAEAALQQFMQRLSAKP